MVAMTASKLNAQVTIGSAEEPNIGSILDIKESQTVDGSPNSEKGVNMPRVELVAKDKLQPMYSYATAAETPTENDIKTHTGLIVYNTHKGDGLCPGIYVWRGSEWVTLYNIPFKPDISIYDTDNNLYTARWYSHDPCDPDGGAYWLTSNLRTTRRSNGQGFSSSVKLNTAKYNGPNMAVSINSKADLPTTTSPKSITYTENGYTVTESYDAYVSKFGLLYNFAQASVACPPGWHVANDIDWQNLFTAIGANSTDKGKRLMANNWAYKGNDSGAPTTANGGGYPPSDPNNFGFWALPAGGGYSNGVSVDLFSSFCFWWADTNKAWYLNWATSDFGGDTRDYSTYYFSVRCVRNN